MQVDASPNEAAAGARRKVKVKRGADGGASLKRSAESANPEPAVSFEAPKEKAPAQKKRKTNEGKAVAVQKKVKGAFRIGEPLPECKKAKVPGKPTAWSKRQIMKIKDSMRGRYKGNLKLQPTKEAKPFETKSRRHWKFAEYRDKYGVYMEWDSIVDYYQGITPDPADFVRRNMKGTLNLQEKFKSGRSKFNSLIKAASDRLPLEARATSSLPKVQKDTKFQRLIEEVTESSFKDVCDLTQAYVVQFIRAGCKAQQDLQEKTQAYAESE